MGHREYFVYIEGDNDIEKLLEKVSNKIKLNDIEEPTIMLYCKSEVLKNFTNGFDGLLKGTVGAVISPEDISLNDVFSEFESIDFRVFEICSLPEDYEKLFKDSEIKIGDKIYFEKQV